MRFIPFILACVLMLWTTAARAQLIGTDTLPGESCAGFPAGASRMTADADQDGRAITLICDGTTWNVPQADGGGGGGGSGPYIFGDGGAGCNAGNEGLVVYDAAGILKICDGAGWNVLFSKYLTCSMWESGRKVACGGSLSSIGQTHPDRASCQSWCEGVNALACEYLAGSGACKAFTACGSYGTSANASYDAAQCFGG
jgi:hypothetical protein